jgi:uncharacterized OsmC-like protein
MTVQSVDAHTDGLWAERVGTRCYTGHNGRGAQVRMGPVDSDGAFTPGELLKIALAGCAGMSSDHTLSRRLGPEVTVIVHVSGPSRDERYPALREEIVVDLSTLTDSERDRAITIVRRAVDRNCTVGRTLEIGATVELTITDREADPR